MKCFLFAAFSLMLLSAISNVPASAQTRVEHELMSYNAITTQTIAQPELTPTDLATFAYRGYFQAQGIRGYGSLIQDHNSGKVTAKTLVQAAIDTNRLPASTLNDRAYLNALDSQVRALDLN